jgi:hypothetical protein
VLKWVVCWVKRLGTYNKEGKKVSALDLLVFILDCRVFDDGQASLLSGTRLLTSISAEI